jgi:hypothetical protein
MKALINDYVFDKTAKTVTFTDFTTIDLAGVLLITNTSTGAIIYNFADPLLGGTVSGKVLTLEYDTTAMSNTDKLQVWYDDAIAESDLLWAIYEGIRELGFLSTLRGTSADLRVAITNGTVTTVSTVTTVGTVTTVTTVGAVTNLAQIGAAPAQQVVPALVNQAAIQSNVNNVLVT